MTNTIRRTSKKHKYSLFISLILIAGQFINNVYALWGILLCLTLLSLFTKSKFIYLNIFFCIYLAFEIWLSALQADNLQLWIFFRDAIRLSLVPIILHCGYKLGEKYHYDNKILYRTVFLFTFLCSIYHIIVVIITFLGDPNLYIITTVRVISEHTLVLGLYLAFFKMLPNKEYYISKKLDRVATAMILIAFLLSFSRTMILLLFCLVIFNLKKQNKRFWKFLFLAGALAVLVAFLMPDITQQFVDKMLNSLVEITGSEKNWTSDQVVKNWRGYETYCANREFQSYSLFEKFFGKGLGASVDVGEYAYLITNEETVPYLHNGYYTTLIKFGIVGVVMAFAFWIAIFLHFLKQPRTRDNKLCLGIILGMAISMFTTHGIFWGYGDITAMIFLGYNFFASNSYYKKMKKKCHMGSYYQKKEVTQTE